MTSKPKRADPAPQLNDADEPLELTNGEPPAPAVEEQWLQPAEETTDRGAGGRHVLGIALTILAGLWLAYSAWSAGRTLAGQPLTSPQIAQWVAVAAGPLALLGLVWLMFGRTRRKEAERFTRSVVAMRSETRSLEALLEVLSQRISDSRSELTMITKHLMQLGDEATGKLGGITREFDTSTEKLKLHGEALDRVAESARHDIAVLLEDLPQAEQTTRLLADQLRSVGHDSLDKASALGRHVIELGERTREADRLIGESTDRLTARVTEIEAAGTAAAARLDEAHAGLSGALDTLLERTSATLHEIRGGIDVQASAVAALVEQASAGIGRAGAEAAESLAANIDHANASIEGLSGRVAEQDRASQRMIAEIERGLALIDERFSEPATNGDDRANHFL